MVIAEAMLADLPAVPSSASLVEAARLLRRNGIVLLPVRSASGLVGYVSEKDLALKGCGSGGDPAAIVVADVMTEDPEKLPGSAPVEAALELMARSGMAAVVVHDNAGQIVGVATLAQVLDGINRPMPEGPIPDSVKRVRGEPL
jgi:CBS domain-containing protein